MQRYADNTPSLSKELHSERKKRIRKLTSNYYGFQKNLKQGLLNSNSTSVIKPTKNLDSSVFKQRPDVLLLQKQTSIHTYYRERTLMSSIVTLHHTKSICRTREGKERSTKSHIHP